MNDRIEKIGHSLIQHGKHNNRIYLMKLAANDLPEIIATLNHLAARQGYSKIFAKVPNGYGPEFLKDGYKVEARVPDFYIGSETALFFAKYFDSIRQKFPQNELLELKTLIAKTPVQAEFSLDSRFQLKSAVENDAGMMSDLYRNVFQSYPFPIQDPEYLIRTMRENTLYFGIWEQEKLIALAAAEMDKEALNVEMTDFAVLPEYRGHQLALFLLRQMETEMKHRGIETAYTIARLKSTGMNITFLKSGYQYAGTLINNTNICGNFESMNVWFKKL